MLRVASLCRYFFLKFWVVQGFEALDFGSKFLCFVYRLLVFGVSCGVSLEGRGRVVPLFYFDPGLFLGWENGR